MKNDKKRLQKFSDLKKKREHINMLIANENNSNSIDNDNENIDNENIDITSKVYKKANSLESNYLEKIKNIDSKDLHKYFLGINKELENYFMQKKLEKIRELETMETGLTNSYYKKKYQKQIRELRESINV